MKTPVSRKKILIIMGTTRENRASDVVTKWVMTNLPTTQNTEFELVDLRDWPLPFFDEPLSPMSAKGEYKNELARKWVDKSKNAAGFVVITAEYNHSIPAVLKNALDYWYSGFVTHKPISFISYGGISAGTRAVEHLHQVAIELTLIPLHGEVNIPLIWSAFNEDGTIKHASQIEHLHAVIAELDAWFDLLK